MDNAIRTNGTGSRGPAGLLTGLLFGGIVGFGAMTLLAPRPGKETRAQIVDKTARFQERAAGTLEDLVTFSHYDNRQFPIGTQRKSESG